MLSEEVETLRDLEQEIVLAIEQDLETGSHHLNNAAHEAFAARYPSLMKALHALSAWVDKQENQYD